MSKLAALALLFYTLWLSLLIAMVLDLLVD